MVAAHDDAWETPTAVLSGDVTIGAGSRILDLAVIHGTSGPVVLGQDVVAMEHALLRGRADHPLTIGDAVLVGPHTHLNGTQVEDEAFVATGVSLFPGSVAGTVSELRIRAVLHVNSRLAPHAVVPIGWIAAGDPAQLFPPEKHDDLWAVREPLDFPDTVYGVQRGTSMREIVRRNPASSNRAPRSRWRAPRSSRSRSHGPGACFDDRPRSGRAHHLPPKHNSAVIAFVW